MYDPLCTLADVKGWLGSKPGEKSNDDDLDWLIQACSEQIGRFCGRDNLGTVVTYAETYKLKRMCQPSILLRHYPVVTLTKVTAANVSRPILTTQQLQAGTTDGVFLEDDGRTLSLLGGYDGYVLVNYTAGYDMPSNGVPFGLRQAAIQFVGEVFRSGGWIGYKSKSLAGETTTFEGGAQWGMSPRTKAMLQPFVNRVPVYQ